MPSAYTVFRLMAGPTRSRLMSQLGQSLRFAHLPATSGLPQSTDIVRAVRLVRFVPMGDIACRGLQLMRRSNPAGH
jgi:hypothetical protein